MEVWLEVRKGHVNNICSFTCIPHTAQATIFDLKHIIIHSIIIEDKISLIKEVEISNTMCNLGLCQT